MATQLFLRQSGITDPSMRNGTGLMEDPGFLESGTYIVSDSALATARGAGVQSQSVPTVASATAPNFQWGLSCISPPVSADITISGTITFNIWGRELADTANRGFTVRLYRYRDADGLLTLIVASDKATELPTSSAAQNWTASPTSTDLEKGDRLVLWVGTEERGGTTTAGVDVFFNTDAASAAVNGDSYMTLTENLTFDDITTMPSGLKLFLTDTTSEVVPAAGTVAKELVADRGAGVASAVFNRSTASTPTAGIQWTVTSDGDEIEWYSQRLEAFTLTGKVKANVRGLMSASGGTHRCGMVVQLAIVDDDGSNALVVGRALALLSGDQGNLSTSEFPLPCVLVLPDTVFGAGKRLRLRVYADDAFVETDEGIGGTGTATLRYAGTSDGASGDAWVQLSQSPADFEEPTPPEALTMAYMIQPAASY